MDLFSQAQSLGVLTEYIDGQGQRRVTDPAALQIIIDALPHGAPSRFVEGAVVLRVGEPARTGLRTAVRLPLAWEIFDGERRIVGGVVETGVIEWPATLDEGTYRLVLTDAGKDVETVPLVVAPHGAFPGRFERGWLLAIQLYGIRSARNWGMGDFTDLEGLVRLARELGADGVGLNPLHALFDDRPAECSPYSPNSRLFLNALYIDVENIPEYQAEVSSDVLGKLRDSPTVDYAAVADIKWRALRAAFTSFRSKPAAARKRDFDAFRKERGELLRRFACFEVLRHRHPVAWWDWPEPWRQPDAAQIEKMCKGPDRLEVEFVEFVQWIADRQLRACQTLARKLGMKVGLYLDVAVGVQAGGFDAWNEPDAISRHLSVGAPPDPLNTAGQNWGLAGFNASGLELRSFEPFREMLRASMRHAGAIRLDHVLGLRRLYLVPHGFSAKDGAYVRMPCDALLAVIAQESVASACIVIGEDLGTVPEGFREQMADWTIWSYKVMMFERDQQGRFRDTGYYPANALVTLNTHDLATYAGWRSFGDLKTKRALGMDPGESDDARWHALGMLDDVLRHHGIAANDLYSVIGFLSRTSSRLLAISLEDLLGVVDQPNIPGTIDEHPNWRQKLPVPLDRMGGAMDIAALKVATAGRSGP